MILGPLRLPIYKSNQVANQAWICDAVFLLPISLEVNDTWARVRIARTYGLVIVKHGLVPQTTVGFRKHGFPVKWSKITLSFFRSREKPSG